jgi:hypothetical protein
VYGVGNNARLPEDEEWFRTAAAEHGVTLAGIIPLYDRVTAADRDGLAVSSVADGPARAAVEEIVDFLEELTVPA